MNIVLKALTRRGKQIIQEFGDEWKVVSSRATVAFSPEPGVWLLVEPRMGSKAEVERARRWIHASHDNHFYMVKEG